MFSDDDSSKTPRNDSLIGNLTGYLDTRIDLVRLELQQKASSVLVSAVHGVALAMLGLVGVDKAAFQGIANKALKDTIYKSDKRQA